MSTDTTSRPSDRRVIDPSDPEAGAGAVIGAVTVQAGAWRSMPWARWASRVGLLPPAPHEPLDVWAGLIVRSIRCTPEQALRQRRREAVLLVVGFAVAMGLLLVVGVTTGGGGLVGMDFDPFAAERGSLPPS